MMMVSDKLNLLPILKDFLNFILFHDHILFNAGVEHCLSQLANIPLPDCGQFGVGHTKSAQKYASHQPIRGDLRRIPSNHTIFVLYEFDGRRTTIIC